LLNILNNAYSVFLKVIKIIIAVLASILVVVVFSNVLCRYILDFSLAWAEETARFLFIWLSFLGAVLANANSEHMNFDLLIKKMPRRIGEIFSIIAYAFILFILFLIIKGGITIVKGNLEWLSSALEISYGLVYSIVPVCSVILALQFLARMFKTIKSLLGISQVD
jgi:TRAP-type transport system small permease protein